nr:MAG TPA: hypothetical protein [Caudoviricetes sp.]
MNPFPPNAPHGAGEFGSTLWTLSKIYLIFRILTLKIVVGFFLMARCRGRNGLMAGVGLCMTAQLLKGCARRPSFARNAEGSLSLAHTNLGLTLKLVP